MRAGAYDCFQRANRSDASAFVIVRPHSPNPAVFKLGAVGVDGPPAHLDPWIHVAVDEQCWSTAASFETANRLPTCSGRVEGMRDRLHFNFKTDVGHVVSIEIGDFSFL